MPSKRRVSKLLRIPTGDGTFIGIKASRGGKHATFWIEGNDEDGPSVSGIKADLEVIDLVITRLQNVRQGMVNMRKAKAKANGAR